MSWFSTWLPLMVAVLFNSAANVLMKVGAMPQVAKADGKPAFVNWATSLAIVLYIGNLAAYWVTLNRLSVSIAFPIMTASSLLIVVAVCIPLLHERLQVSQMVGIVVIIVGVWLLSGGAEMLRSRPE